jgi:hypothetical protein
MIVLNEAHLRAVLGELQRYYNEARPHRALAWQTPTLAIARRHGARTAVSAITTTLSAHRGWEERGADGGAATC